MLNSGLFTNFLLNQACNVIFESIFVTMKNLGFLIMLLLAGNCLGQEGVDLNTQSAILLKMGFGWNIPAGDLSARFGTSSSVGGGVDYVFPNGRWALTGHYTYHYGNNVKEDVLDQIRNERGILIGDDGFPADLFLRQRMYYGQLGLLHILPLNQGSKNQWALELGGGVGYLQHWIRLQDERNTARQINGAYESGYDRMTRGVSVFEYVGIRYLQANKRVNFYFGLEFTQSFTKNTRPWDYDLRSAETDGRIDLLNGLKIGWILPFYLDVATEEIFY